MIRVLHFAIFAQSIKASRSVPLLTAARGACTDTGTCRVAAPPTAAFAPRVNQGTPWVECNTDPPLLIDANFSTFWAPERGWSRFALKALLNSVWCRAFMEAAGTPLGGGALKLEATHLRQMPVPLLTKDARSALEAAGKRLTRDAEDVQAQINHIVLQALLPEKTAEATLSDLAEQMAVQTSDLCAVRQRAAS